MKFKIIALIAALPVALAVGSYLDRLGGSISVGTDSQLAKPLVSALKTLEDIKSRITGHCRKLCDKYLPSGWSSVDGKEFDGILESLELSEYGLASTTSGTAQQKPLLGPYKMQNTGLDLLAQQQPDTAVLTTQADIPLASFVPADKVESEPTGSFHTVQKTENRQ